MSRGTNPTHDEVVLARVLAEEYQIGAHRSLQKALKDVLCYYGSRDTTTTSGVQLSPQLRCSVLAERLSFNDLVALDEVLSAVLKEYKLEALQPAIRMYRWTKISQSPNLLASLKEKWETDSSFHVVFDPVSDTKDVSELLPALKRFSVSPEVYLQPVKDFYDLICHHKNDLERWKQDFTIEATRAAETRSVFANVPLVKWSSPVLKEALLWVSNWFHGFWLVTRMDKSMLEERRVLYVEETWFVKAATLACRLPDPVLLFDLKDLNRERIEEIVSEAEAVAAAVEDQRKDWPVHFGPIPFFDTEGLTLVLRGRFSGGAFVPASHPNTLQVKIPLLSDAIYASFKALFGDPRRKKARLFVVKQKDGSFVVQTPAHDLDFIMAVISGPDDPERRSVQMNRAISIDRTTFEAMKGALPFSQARYRIRCRD